MTFSMTHYDYVIICQALALEKSTCFPIDTDRIKRIDNVMYKLGNQYQENMKKERMKENVSNSSRN